MTWLSSRTSNIQLSDKVISVCLSLTHKWMDDWTQGCTNIFKKDHSMVPFLLFQNVKISLAFNMYFAMDFVDRFIGLLPNWVKFIENAAIKCWKNEINCWRFLIATKKKKKESNNNYYCNKRSKNGKIKKLIEWEFHFLTCDGKTIWWTDTTGIIFTKLSTWGGFIRFLLNVGARASLMKSEI